MKTLLHLSDLHFGTERTGIVSELEKAILNLNPDLIVVSGDLTQRARQSQFISAFDFLKKIAKSAPIICVPGNHDISLYNLAERLLYPFNKYNKYVNKHFCSSYQDEDLAIFGINSVNPFKIMSGWVTDSQLQQMSNFFKNIPNTCNKIIVMHHNLIRSERHKMIHDAEKIMTVFADAKINLVLAGHIHQPLIEQLERHYLKHPMFVVTAGTAISHRTIAPNSFNIIDIDKTEFTLKIFDYEQQLFINNHTRHFSLIKSD